jgi:integrase/recombinase XerD
VDALLQAPDPAKKNGLRDRAMLQLLYATGLRVTELCTVETAGVNLDLGIVRVIGKGRKERIVPLGRSAVEAIQQYLESGRTGVTSRKGGKYYSLQIGQRHDATMFFGTC